MTKRRIIKSVMPVFLSFVLVLSGIIPGTPFVKTAHAAGDTIEIKPGSDESKTGTGEMLISLAIHKHEFQYSADGAIITASCKCEYGDCDLPDKKVTLTLQAPTKKMDTDSGSAKAILDAYELATFNTVTGLNVRPDADIEYYKGEEKLDGAPTEKGDYNARLWVHDKDDWGNEATAKVNYSIGTTTQTHSMTITLTIAPAEVKTAPTAKELTYNGSNQALVTAGEAKTGTMQYQIGESAETEPSGTWGASIPEKKDTGTYYVWYRAYVGEANVSEAGCVTVKIASVDKTELNAAIEAAVEYYETIKDNADYKEPATTLYNVIVAANTVAENDNVTAEAVADCTAAVKAAKDAAKAAVDEIIESNEEAFEDEKTAQKDAADALAKEGDSDAAKKLIEDAKEAIDDLDFDETKTLDENKAEIRTIIATLADELPIQRAEDTINALPASDKVETTDKEAIEAARAAYEALTDEQKEKVSAETLKKLEDAEAALSAAEVKETSEKITNLPDADKVTADDKEAIEAARAAYEALTDEQKEQVGAQTIAKLEAAEAALAIAKLPAASEVTSTDKEAIEAARAKYDALTDEQKAQVGDAAKAKLEAVEAALLIAELPETVTTSDKEAVEAARAAYEALSDEQKAQVGEEALAKLEEAEVGLVKALIKALPNASAVKTSDADKVAEAAAAYDQLNEDQKAKITAAEKSKLDAVKEAVKDAQVYEVKTMINALPAPDEVTVSDEEAIQAARGAYEALTDEQKAQVGKTAAGKIVTDETALAIAKLPEASEVTVDDKEAIVAARAAYDALTDAQREEIGEAAKAKLEDAEAVIKEAEDTAAANAVIEKINALPDFDNVTVDNKEAIEAAKAAYDALTDAQKEKVLPETRKKLMDAEDKLVILQVMSEVTPKTGKDAAYTGNPIPLVNAPTTALPEGYSIKYAVTTENVAPTDESVYLEEIPAETETGTYYVWYKVVGYDKNIEPKCVKVRIINTGMFADIEYGSWQYTAAESVYDKGIMTGKGMVDGKVIFAPNDKMNRSQFVTAIYAMDGKPDVEEVHQQFVDVKETDWFAKAVTWASNNGIAAGIGDGKFGPNNAASREQIALMLYKYAQYKGYDVSVSESTTLDGFTDGDQVHSWALEAVKWAVERKIISGKGKAETGLKIAPAQSASRIECAAMLNKFAEVYAGAIPVEILEEPIALPMEDVEEAPVIDETEDIIVDENEDVIDEEEEIVDEGEVVIDEEEVIADEDEVVIDEAVIVDEE